jgi:hypothetical protein
LICSFTAFCFDLALKPCPDHMTYGQFLPAADRCDSNRDPAINHCLLAQGGRDAANYNALTQALRDCPTRNAQFFLESMRDIGVA